jgi:hypothetical protein
MFRVELSHIWLPDYEGHHQAGEVAAAFPAIFKGRNAGELEEEGKIA